MNYKIYTELVKMDENKTTAQLGMTVDVADIHELADAVESHGKQFAAVLRTHEENRT